MKSIRIWLAPEVLSALDDRVRDSGGSRSSFVREVVAREIDRLIREQDERGRLEDDERRHREGYLRFPIAPGEFDLSFDNDSPSDW